MIYSYFSDVNKERKEAKEEGEKRNDSGRKKKTSAHRCIKNQPRTSICIFIFLSRDARHQSLTMAIVKYLFIFPITITAPPSSPPLITSIPFHLHLSIYINKQLTHQFIYATLAKTAARAALVSANSLRADSLFFLRRAKSKEDTSAAKAFFKASASLRASLGS